MALAARPGTISFEGRDDALRAELDAAQKSREFLEDHRADWRLEHPDEWVAVFECRVVAFAPTLDAMIRALLEREIPANQVVLERLTTDDAVYIL